METLRMTRRSLSKYFLARAGGKKVSSRARFHATVLEAARVCCAGADVRVRVAASHPRANHVAKCTLPSSGGEFRRNPALSSGVLF